LATWPSCSASAAPTTLVSFSHLRPLPLQIPSPLWFQTCRVNSFLSFVFFPVACLSSEKPTLPHSWHRPTPAPALLSAESASPHCLAPMVSPWPALRPHVTSDPAPQPPSSALARLALNTKAFAPAMPLPGPLFPPFLRVCSKESPLSAPCTPSPFLAEFPQLAQCGSHFRDVPRA